LGSIIGYSIKENAGLDVLRLGIFLGVADVVYNIHSFYILPESGIPIVAGTVQRVTQLELQTDANKQRIKSFNDKIADRFKEEHLQYDGDKPNLDDWGDLYEDDEDFVAEFYKVFDNDGVKEADDEFDLDSFDHYLHMELAVDHGREYLEYARVTKRLKDHQGNPIGTANDNPILDIRMYEVEYYDGSKQVLSTNVIAKNMFASIDKEGHQHLLLDSIVDVRKSKDAISKDDAYVKSSNSVNRQVETTKGWEVLCQ